MTSANTRTADYPIDPMFLERWSPRSLTGDSIEEVNLMTMLEAARWAPSAFNAQPWRFIYARRETPPWDKLLSLLIPFNQGWARNASALIFIVSNSRLRQRGNNPETTSYTHSLDAGTAAGYLALQANRMGWFVHGMSGFDVERAPSELGVPEGWRVEAAYAVGKLGDKTGLPEALRMREAPSNRRPLSELAFEGTFRDAGTGAV